ncbi:MAG: Ig-like domain-containing protein [Actinomycetota bacterium]|nr:Ig-like domain-containing protein [Actinomycetota bacterium]
MSTNQLLTLIAAVAGSPSGTITFYNGYAPIASCQGLSVSSSTPIAVCEIAFAASASPVRVTAAFVSANGATGGSSQAQTVDVVSGSTTTSIRASNPSARVGRAVTYTASVAPSNQGPAIPSGSVKFIQDGKPLAHCSGVALQASTGGISASCTLRYTTPGIRQVTAIYSGNQDFGGSSSSPILVPVQALGRISSSMLWTFRWTASYTTIASMSVNGVSLGTNVIVTCKGHGCPFARRASASFGVLMRTPTSKHRCGKGPIALAGTFHRNRLMVGTRITVEIRRPGWIGKFYSFVVVSGRTPQVRISCLAPGLSKPGIDC